MAKRVLNETVAAVEQAQLSWESIEIAGRLQKEMLTLKSQFISEDGKSVDYANMKKSDIFKDYIRNCQQLHYLDLTKLSLVEKKVFFISISLLLLLHPHHTSLVLDCFGSHVSLP